jgi:hypothetical protein
VREDPPNMEPLIQILRYAAVNDTAELRARIPSWQQVVARFGDKAKIVGLETCEAFRNQVPNERDRILGAAGIFNSGTNVLFQVLNSNCRIPRAKTQTKTGIMWQVNWGKHQPPRFRFENSVDASYNNSRYMPVVITRDPYTWMQSMCKSRYSAHWFHVVPDHCPNLIPNEVEQTWFREPEREVRRHFKNNVWKVDNVLDKANYTPDSKIVPVRVRYKSTLEYHTSLAHMWKDWYQEYYDVKFPRLIIRLEDLVFHPRQILHQVCECAGGKLSENITLAGESSKKGAIHGMNKTNLADAMILHVYSNRTKGMTIDDLQYAKETFKGSVMSAFGYLPPL